jgi:hypothetical protein
MLKHLFLILILTFIVGLMTGVYAFFVVTGPEEVRTEVPREEAEDGFVITSDMYGGCQMLGACPSYRIVDTGDYIYISREREDTDERFEGSLSRAQLADLETLLRSADLEEIEDSIFTETCPSAFDGAAYTYEIVYGGEEYDIDTCAEDTFGEPLFQTLEDYFSVFSLLHNE